MAQASFSLDEALDEITVLSYVINHKSTSQQISSDPYGKLDKRDRRAVATAAAPRRLPTHARPQAREAHARTGRQQHTESLYFRAIPNFRVPN
eukprot:2560928-Pleurochrysis_carterae.AAC.1